MSRLVGLALTVLVAASSISFGQSDQALHPSFEDESLRDPFLTPTNISGPLDGEDPSEWGQPESYGYDPAVPEALFEPDGESCVAIEPAAARRSPFMDSGVTATWLKPVDGFGISDVDARTQIIIPVFVKGSPLRVSLGAGTTMIDAPKKLDVPDQLYNVTAELRWYIPLRESWGVDLGAGGGVFSDMDGSAGKGFRVTGRAILVKELNPCWKLSGGILYLGRKNLLAMPIAGAIYTPRDDFRVEVLIPRPRVLKRVRLNGTREHWIYAGGEIFGGNTWSITQTTGAEDTFIYKDNRVLVGYETKAPGCLAFRAEAGYVFMRKVEFEEDPTTLDPGSTIMLRAGITY